MLSCKEVTAHASQALDQPPGWFAGLSLRMHLFMCVDCRRYVLQLGLVSRATRSPTPPAEPDEAAVDRTLGTLMARRGKDTGD